MLRALRPVLVAENEPVRMLISQPRMRNCGHLFMARPVAPAISRRQRRPVQGATRMVDSQSRQGSCRSANDSSWPMITSSAVNDAMTP